MPDEPDFSNLYNTPIPPSKKVAWEKYLSRHPQAKRDYFNYDVQGDWLAGANRDERGHGSDKFKKPNHPTFSVESKYSTSQHPGGRWITDRNGKGTFMADPSNFLYHDPQDLQRYFHEVEPHIQLNMPPTAPGPAKAPVPTELQQKQQKAMREQAALANPIQSIQDFGKWFQNLLANPQPVPAESFFQARITHTPGIGIPPQKEALAMYDESQDPLAAIARSHYTPEEKAILTKSWAPEGKGMILATPKGLDSPAAMRHEQIHRLQSQVPALKENAFQIAAQVDPLIITTLENWPLYQREMQQRGKWPTLANEGTAYDQIPGLITGLKEGPSKGLHDYVSNLIATDPSADPSTRRRHLRQFEQLTDVSTLPDAKSKP